LGGITIGRTDGRSRWDAGANWVINAVGTASQSWRSRLPGHAADGCQRNMVISVAPGTRPRERQSVSETPRIDGVLGKKW